ncbi:MAG: NAD-dependent epimerase/dehydratase family protein [Verrucomicrobiota bacterium]
MKCAVTGAFGYSGKYIAQRLLHSGHEVITLTNSLNRDNPFHNRIPAFPFNFDAPSKLTATLLGVDVLINTYWVRFNHKLFTHAEAVRNTLVLFESARKAGVQRVVHVSITNPSKESPLEYFRGKAQLEEALTTSGLSHAILRPALLFGKEDILINNIAWALRHLPIFGVFGDGLYRLQPIYVDDLASIAVEQATGKANVVINAIGPETFTYRDMVTAIGELMGKKKLVVSVPPDLAYFAGKVIGFFLNDVLITREEVHGLMANLLYVPCPPAGATKLTEWVKQNANVLGMRYASELDRRRDRTRSYGFT